MTGNRWIQRAVPGGVGGRLTDLLHPAERLGRHPMLRAGLMLLLGTWFFVVFPTEPLYFENQNTKFLHGMALVGIGHLDRDWTAGTVDVMPVFTAIVYALHLGPPAVGAYLLQIILFAVFLYSTVRLAAFAAGPAADGPRFRIVVGLLVVASQFSNAGARVWGGVAQQYLLGPALEPQSFGVLFLLAVVLFLGRRTESPLLVAAVPAIVHPGYVVPAGTLILAFLITAWLRPDPSRRPRLRVTLTALTAAAASMVYLGLMILPTDAASWQAANEILAQIRIPRHAVPAHWFDVDAAAKVVGLILALGLVRRRSPDLFKVIAFPSAIALGLTLLAVALDSNELGMISPWRISVYLVPMGLAALLGCLVAACLARRAAGRTPHLFRALGAALLLLALAVTIRGGAETSQLYRPMPPADHIAFMRATGTAGTLYLTDPENMTIRLESGLPQLVSWKSHPYKDVEVLEWYRRYQLAERVFSGLSIDCRALAQAVEAYGITHLLLEDPRKTVGCGGMETVFEGSKARIYRLSP